MILPLLLLASSLSAAPADFNGRWNIKLDHPRQRVWWLEVNGAGTPQMSGWFVGAPGGQVDKIPSIRMDGDTLVFSFSRKRDDKPLELVYKAKFEGGVLVGERVARVLIERGGEFEHGYTYSGHPVACAVGLANLDLIEQQGLVQRVREDTGPYLARQLAALSEHPIVGEVQSCGLMAAVQLCRHPPTHEAFALEHGIGLVCRRHCFDSGLVMRAVGDRMIVAPPLVITRAEIDEMCALARQALDRTHAEARAAGWLPGG